MENRIEFGKIMRTARKRRGMTQKELAELVGVSTVYCREVEYGRYTPTWVIWLRICTALDIDIDSVRNICVIPELKELGEVLRHSLLK